MLKSLQTLDLLFPAFCLDEAAAAEKLQEIHDLLNVKLRDWNYVLTRWLSINIQNEDQMAEK